VPIRGVVCAVAVGRLRIKDNSTSMNIKHILVVDPSENEMGLLDGGGCFAFMFDTGIHTSSTENYQNTKMPTCEAVWSNWQATSSHFDENELVQARKLARIAVKEVWKAMKESVERVGAPLRQEINNLEETVGAIDDEKMEI
jgi:exosome complex RNA-binding protein Rrp42 (RNase PH superfamily)